MVALVATALAPAAGRAQLPQLPPTLGLPPPSGQPPGPNPSQGRPPTIGSAPEAGDVVSYRGNPQHTRAAGDDTVFGPLVRLWTRRFNGPVWHPLLAGRRVVVNVAKSDGSGGYGSEVVAVDPATGRDIWRRATPGTYFSAPIAIDSGRVFSMNVEGLVRAFALRDGKPLWTHQLPGQFSTLQSVPVAANGSLYIATSDGSVHALDGATGQELWSRQVTSHYQVSMPALDGDRVIAADGCGNATALRRTDGAIVWSREVNSGSACGAVGVGIAYGGRFFASSPLYSTESPGWVFDSATGADRGRFAGGAPDAVGGDLAFTTVTQGRLSGVSLDTGAARWQLNGHDGTRETVRPIVSGETVFATTRAGELLGLDRATGAVRTSLRLPDGGTTSVGGLEQGMAAGHGVVAVGQGVALSEFAPVLQPAPTGTDAASTITDVIAGKRVRLVGGLGSAIRGAGRPLVLESDRYPFGRFAKSGAGRTFADGTAYFHQRLTRNTRFRARLAGRKTPQHVGTIYVYPRAHSALYALDRGRGELRLTLAAGPDFRVGARRLVAYLARRSSRHYERLGSASLVQAGRGRARTRVRFRRPRHTGRHDYIYWCVRGLRGYGRPDALARHCGARRIKG